MGRVAACRRPLCGDRQLDHRRRITWHRDPRRLRPDHPRHKPLRAAFLPRERMTSLANLPYFLAYFAASILLLAAFLGAYTLITPLHEWTLIRQGNTAAALSLAGATLGFTLPLASAIVHSAS